MIVKKTFAAMIVPSITPTWRYAARENSSPAPHAARATSPVPMTASATWLPCPTVKAEEVVDDPCQRDPGNAQRDRLPLVEVRCIAIDEPQSGVEVVEDDHEREARQPRRIRLPLEPVERLGHLGRSEPVLLRVVEPAAVNAPELACDARLGVLLRLGARRARSRRTK